MIVLRTLFALILLLSTSARSEEMPELATLLALFSANASDHGNIRLNWTLDQQSPTVVKFRIYRGYEELGNFSVLTEVPFHAESGQADYLFQDTSAIPGVTYYYKLASQGQLNESIFPVVISAAVPVGGTLGGQNAESPALVLPGDKLRVYLKQAGHLRVERSAPDKQVLVDTLLTAGIYEFEATDAAQTISVKVDDSFEKTVTWPLK